MASPGGGGCLSGTALVFGGFIGGLALGWVFLIGLSKVLG